MTLSEKKEYLNLYKIHNAKIRRLKELIGDYPDESEKYKENLRFYTVSILSVGPKKSRMRKRSGFLLITSYFFTIT